MKNLINKVMRTLTPVSVAHKKALNEDKVRETKKREEVVEVFQEGMNKIMTNPRYEVIIGRRYFPAAEFAFDDFYSEKNAQEYIEKGDEAYINHYGTAGQMYKSLEGSVEEVDPETFALTCRTMEHYLQAFTYADGMSGDLSSPEKYAEYASMGLYTWAGVYDAKVVENVEKYFEIFNKEGLINAKIGVNHTGLEEKKLNEWDEQHRKMRKEVSQ